MVSGKTIQCGNNLYRLECFFHVPICPSSLKKKPFISIHVEGSTFNKHKLLITFLEVMDFVPFILWLATMLCLLFRSWFSKIFWSCLPNFGFLVIIQGLDWKFRVIKMELFCTSLFMRICFGDAGIYYTSCNAHLSACKNGCVVVVWFCCCLEF
jgi:hypothetical protein